MSILDYIRPNIFNNPVANSTGMYNPNKKFTNKNVDNLTALQQYKMSKQQPNFDPFKTNITESYAQNIIPEQAIIDQQENDLAYNQIHTLNNTPTQQQVTNQKLQSFIPQIVVPQTIENLPKTQSKTNILGEQISMDQLPKGVGYVNGKLFDSNKQSTQGMFNGYSKERDAALDSYGKVDKNSEFYKRNKKAMENLQ